MVVSVRTMPLTDVDLKAYKVLAACCLGNLASGFPVNSFGTVLLYVVSYLREEHVSLFLHTYNEHASLARNLGPPLLRRAPNR